MTGVVPPVSTTAVCLVSCYDGDMSLFLLKLPHGLCVGVKTQYTNKIGTVGSSCCCICL
jgi:hypothetical protein